MTSTENPLDRNMERYLRAVSWADKFGIRKGQQPRKYSTC